MKRIDLLSVMEWDDLELLRAEAGKVFGEQSEKNWADYHRLNESVPRVETVDVVAGRDGFLVTPATGQVHNQLVYGTLYRITRGVGWRVSNLVKSFDPLLAFDVARRYGRARLRYTSSWWKVTIPAALHIKSAQQEHPDSVRWMIEALAAEEHVMSLGNFISLSAHSIAKTLPSGEASQYLEAMGVRTRALG